jgi:hypothetical protein
LVWATCRDTAADEREYGSESNEVEEAKDTERYGCAIASEKEVEGEWPDETSYSCSGYRRESIIGKGRSFGGDNYHI